MRTIYRNIVVAMIFSNDGRLLIGKKDPRAGGVYADSWHLPGGGMHDHETKYQALVREMREELGLDISWQRLWLIDDLGRGKSQKRLSDGEVVDCEMRFWVYRIDLDRNAVEVAITPGDDLVKTIWISVPQIPDYRMTPPSVALFARLKPDDYSPT